MKPPFKLIEHERPSHETVACLRALLKEAEEGSLIGFAHVAMYKRRVWDRNVCGEAYRNQAWTVSMLMAYTVKLANEVNYE